MFLRQTGKQVGVRGGDEFCAERLGNRRDELQEGQAGVNLGGALARLLYQRGYVISGHVEQALEALRLLIRVNVYALAVLH